MSSVGSSLDKIDHLLEKWGGRDTPARVVWLKPEERVVLAHQGIKDEEIFRRLERTRALKAAFQNTHYLFNHSNSADHLALYLFYREFERLQNPQRNFHHWLPFRGPNAPSLNESLLWEENVVSVDCYDLSTAKLESAISFAQDNKTDPFKDSRCWSLAEGDFAKWGLPIHFETEFVDLVDQCVPKGKRDISWAILVPKERVLEMGYFAHAMGFPCKCFKGREVEVLDALQKSKLDASTSCVFGPPPQYRLFPKQLTPENGVMIEHFGGFSSAEMEKITKKIGLFAKRVFDAAETLKSFENAP